MFGYLLGYSAVLTTFGCVLAIFGLQRKVKYTETATGNEVVIADEGQAFSVYPQQCRRLIKKERRRVWIYSRAIGDESIGCGEITFDNSINNNWIEFVEVKKRK